MALLVPDPCAGTLNDASEFDIFVTGMGLVCRCTCSMTVQDKMGAEVDGILLTAP